MKMLCNEVRDNLDRFLDGELPDSRRAVLAAHLEACPDCREEMESTRQATAAMAGLPHPTCPERVVERIEASVRLEDREPSLAERLRELTGVLRWRPLAAALPIVAAVLLVVLLYPTGKTPDSAGDPDEELRKAEKQASWTLSYVAQTINNAQEKSVEELVKKSLRSMIRTRLRDAVQRTEGDKS